MIYTVTPNPSIDYYLTVGNTEKGGTNRAANGRFVYGGKGINVAGVCRSLGMPAVALGFAGGFIGDELQRLLDADGIPHDFVRAEECTRINVKCHDADGITEINAPGAYVSAADVELLSEKLRGCKAGDTVVLSGSQPPCEVRYIYAYIMKRHAGRGINFIVDTAGEALESCLPFRPELIKPNYREFCELFGKSEIPESELPAYAGKLTDAGAQSVLLSLGGRGAMLYSNGAFSFCRVPECGLKPVNTTGAGDSMIAGYLFAKRKGLPLLECTVASGCAAAYSEGLCDYPTVKTVYEAIIKETLI